MSLVNSAQPHAARQESPAPPAPHFLTIRFTTAHDCERIHALFNGHRKQQIDPKGKVRTRSKEELLTPVSQGSAIIATDPNGEIRFFGMASDHFQYTGNLVAITELGGIMSDVRGFRLTQVASAMLALREAIRLREQYPCIASHGLHALVAKDNEAAIKVFGRDLQWQDIDITARRSSLFEAQGKYTCPDARASRLWFSFQANAINSARTLVTDALAQESLTSKNGDKISIALDPSIRELV